MNATVIETVVPSIPLAALCEYTAWPDVPATITRLYERLYALLPPARLAPGGHNICVYQTPGDRGADLEVGVQVVAPFDTPESSDLYSTMTPAGRAASFTHFGDYAGVRGAHERIQAWCQANAREAEGTRWEVYGHWSDDPRQRRTDVYWLLAD